MKYDPVINTLRDFVQTGLGNHLAGYAARAAGQELLESWESALADGNKGNLANDIDKVIEQLQVLKAKALEELPLANDGLAGKPLEHWKQLLADQGITVYCSGLPRRQTSGFRFTGMAGSDFVEERSAVIEAVKRYLPEGGYAFTPLQLATARVHPLAVSLGSTGWVMLADLNTFGQVVYLVSEHRDRSVAFPCDKPYHDFMRQRAWAENFAHERPETPQTPAEPAELVITPLVIA
ncbi:hypothetical protein G3A43_08495 [Paraburkholderia aspalathi]|nr:hypothetical protein [Paraburkholderia aspalathi]MBK3780295.1 hypothetical protein [Paraburkholderia aspalathi]